MKNLETLEHITIDKLIFGGKGLATAPDGRKIIISGGCIPGSIVNLRILKVRKSHYEAQQLEVIQKSPIEIDLPEGFQMYGGAKWLTIGYDDQLKIKEGQVREAFFHLQDYTKNALWHAIVPSPELYGYRNKVEFSWGKYISGREGIHDDFRFGFHAQGQFDRIENCTYCALADQKINDIFHDIDSFSRASGFSTYDPKTAEGFWRHLVVRKAKKTGEIMLIFSINSLWNVNEQEKEGSMEYFFTEMVQKLIKKHTELTSIYFFENTGRADIVTGNPVLLFGKESITENLLGLTFEIQPKSFFQVNTLGAEGLYSQAINFIQHKGGTLLDLYAGTGTIGILLSPHFKKVYSVEIVADASRDGEKNAMRNNVHNVEFICEKAEDFAKKFASSGNTADTIIIDPPRDGMHPSTLPNIASFAAREIIYVSCNPATLARDLEVLVGKKREGEEENGAPQKNFYRITDIVPVDMFPHTHHIETVVRLEKI